MPIRGAHRRRVVKKPQNVAKIAKNAVQRMSETKIFETDIDNTVLHTTSVCIPLSGIAIGSTNITRIGDEITVRSLHLQGEVRSNITDNIATAIRLILFQWHPTDGTAPVNANILRGATIGRITARGYVVNGRKNFTVLKDVYKMVASEPGGPFLLNFNWHLHKKFRKKIFYADTAITGLNNFYLLAVSDFATGTTGAVFFGGVRMNYLDL